MTKLSRARRSFLTRFSCHIFTKDEKDASFAAAMPLSRPKSAVLVLPAKESRTSLRSTRKPQVNSPGSSAYSSRGPNWSAPTACGAADVLETEYGTFAHPLTTPGSGESPWAPAGKGGEEYFQQHRDYSEEEQPLSAHLPDPSIKEGDVGVHGSGDEPSLRELANNNNSSNKTNTTSVRQLPPEAADAPDVPRRLPLERVGQDAYAGQRNAAAEILRERITGIADAERSNVVLGGGSGGPAKAAESARGFSAERPGVTESRKSWVSDAGRESVGRDVYSSSAGRWSIAAFRVEEGIRGRTREVSGTAANREPSSSTTFEGEDAATSIYSESTGEPYGSQAAVASQAMLRGPTTPKDAQQRGGFPLEAAETVHGKRDTPASATSAPAGESCAVGAINEKWDISSRPSVFEDDCSSQTTIDSDDMDDVTPTARISRFFSFTSQVDTTATRGTARPFSCGAMSMVSDSTEFEDGISDVGPEESDLWMIPPRIAVATSETTDNTDNLQPTAGDDVAETPVTAILARNPPPWMQEAPTATSKGAKVAEYDNASVTSIETDDMDDDVTPTANSSRQIPPWLQERQKTAKEHDTCSLTTIETDGSGSIYAITSETSGRHSPTIRQEIHVSTVDETAGATTTLTDRLTAAILSHDLPLVLRLLDIPHLNLNTQDSQGRSPVLLSLQCHLTRGQDDGILSVLLARTDVNLNAVPILHAAITANSAAAVALLLQRKDLDVNLGAPSTPLELAVARGTDARDVVTLLLQRKDLDVNKNAVVHAAIRTGCEEIVRLLVAREDLDVNRTHEGRTPKALAEELAAETETETETGGEAGGGRGILGILKARADLH